VEITFLLSTMNIALIHCRRSSIRLLSCMQRSYSSSESGKDGGTDIDVVKGDAEAAKKATDNLKDLLRRIAEDRNKNGQSDSSRSHLDLAKPIGRKKGEEERAAREAEQKEMEEYEGIDPVIISSAKEVASSFGDPSVSKELLKHLLEPQLSRLQEEESKATSKSDENELNDILSGMTVDRTKAKQEFVAMGRAAQIKQRFGNTLKSGGYQRRQKEQSDKIDLFGAKPLGIFDVNTIKQTEQKELLATWDMLRKRELSLKASHPPRNGFEEMIQWTEQGKLWTFPIDNEKDLLPEENDVSFAEHVFLEPHLEGWCPKEGPLRHFMHLVCVGLSKNPYLTAEEKRNHIFWFKDYFEAKKEVLELARQNAEKDKLKQDL